MDALPPLPLPATHPPRPRRQPPPATCHPPTTHPSLAGFSVHGCSFEEVQGKASHGFAEVGARAIQWLNNELSGCASVALVTWGGTKARDGRALEVFFLELQRHDLELPRGKSFVGIDLLHVARTTKCYARLSAEQWPPRVPPSGRQQRGGPLLELPHAATYSLTQDSALGGGGVQAAPAQRRRGAPQGGAVTWNAASNSLSAMCDDTGLAGVTQLGIVADVLAQKAYGSGDDMIFLLDRCKGWAAALSAYEAELREDPVPRGWREPDKPGGGQVPPGFRDEDALRRNFTAQQGKAKFGGPSAELRAKAGTLEHPGRLELGPLAAKLSRPPPRRIPDALDSDEGEEEREEGEEGEEGESGEEREGESGDESGGEGSGEGGVRPPCERPWAELSPQEQQQAKVISFVESTWDADDWVGVSLTWAALQETRREKRAAEALGFTEKTWQGGGSGVCGGGLWLKGRRVGARYDESVHKGRVTDWRVELEGSSSVTMYRVHFDDGEHSWLNEGDFFEIDGVPPDTPHALSLSLTPSPPPPSPK